jgi:hypothetical protein
LKKLVAPTQNCERSWGFSGVIARLSDGMITILSPLVAYRWNLSLSPCDISNALAASGFIPATVSYGCLYRVWPRVLDAAVVKWHRKGFRIYWRWRSCRPGRPKTSAEIRPGLWMARMPTRVIRTPNHVVCDRIDPVLAILASRKVCVIIHAPTDGSSLLLLVRVTIPREIVQAHKNYPGRHRLFSLDLALGMFLRS